VIEFKSGLNFQTAAADSSKAELLLCPAASIQQKQLEPQNT
jgi:hypothetical protein